VDIWNQQLSVQVTTSVILRSLCLQCHKKCKRNIRFKHNFNLQKKPATISACDNNQHQADHKIINILQPNRGLEMSNLKNVLL